MCLATICTTHPTYPFILISNRDELLHRKTARATWWAAPHAHVLGGRDQQAAAQGTWLGVTRDGRLALLTNFREESRPVAPASRSRGELPKLFLTPAPADAPPSGAFATQLVEHSAIQELDGFSLIFGRMRGADAALGIVSNRTPRDARATIWMPRAPAETWGQTCALSNSRFGDRAWRKVVDAEALLADAVRTHAAAGGDTDALLDACFGVLGTDTLPRARAPDDEFQSYARALRESIFVPPIVVEAGLAGLAPEEAVRAGGHVYGTQVQTVVLCDAEGKVTFVERTLRDERAVLIPDAERERRFEFDIQAD